MFTLEEINDKICENQRETTKWKDLKKALQEVCSHDWSYNGHGHNDDFYRCNKCEDEKAE